MEFKVEVEVHLLPGPTTFLSLVNAKEILVTKYRWKYVYMDSGAEGKIVSEEDRTISFVLGGKDGANIDAAKRDVHDALLGVGNTVRFIRHLTSAVSQVPVEIATGVGKAAGGAIGGAVANAGKETGLGSLGILGFGAVASALVLGVVGAALVISAKRG